MLDKLIKLLLGNWQVAGGILALLALSHLTAYCTGRSDGYDKRVAEEAHAAEEARKLSEKSAGEAAQEREADNQTVTDNQEGRDNAIEATESTGAPSAASNALNCERLRRAGRDLQQFPACRGREN